MKFLKKILVPVASLFLLTACGGAGVEAPLESVLPADTGMVVVLDGSDDGQRAQVKDIWSRFPDFNVEEKLREEIPEDRQDFAQALVNVVKNDWKFVLSASNLSEDSADFYLAGEFEKPDDAQKVIEIFAEEEGLDLEVSEKDGADYWTNAEESIYLARYMNVFVATNNITNRDLAVGRLQSGEGFEMEEDVDVDGVLGYAYIEEDVLREFMDLLASFDQDLGVVYDERMLDVLGDMLVTFAANDKGFVMNSKQELVDDEELVEEIFGNLQSEVSLVDKVSGEGVFYYMEQTSLKPLMDAFSQGFLLGFSQVDPAIDALAARYVDNFVGALAEDLNVSEEEFMTFVDSPFAFAGSDVGTYYPTFSMYLDLEEEDLVAAEGLVLKMDEWMDQLIVALDEEVSAQNLTGIVKKDVDLVGGSGLHRVYVDFEVLPAEIASFASFLPGFDLNSLKVEFYYGVVAEDVFVAALYPDFPEAYGKEILADNELYENVMGELSGDAGYSVFYGATSPVVALVDRWVEIGVAAGQLPESFIPEYELYFKKTFGAFKNLASKSWYEDGATYGEAILMIEEVK